MIKIKTEGMQFNSMYFNKALCESIPVSSMRVVRIKKYTIAIVFYSDVCIESFNQTGRTGLSENITGICFRQKDDIDNGSSR